MRDSGDGGPPATGSDGDAGNGRDSGNDPPRLSHDAYVLLITALAALLVALIRAAAGGPVYVVLLAGAAGLIGVGVATRKIVNRTGQDPSRGAYLVVGGACLGAGLLAGLERLWLTTAIFSLLGVMSFGPVYEQILDERS